MKPLLGVLLTLAVLLLFHFISIVIYHHRYHDNTNRVDNRYNNRDYITTLNELNTSLTMLNAYLKLKKNGPQSIKSLQSSSPPPPPSSSSSSSITMISKQQSSSESKNKVQQQQRQQDQKRARTALLFTMDSITEYESNSMRGGASGNDRSNLLTTDISINDFTITFVRGNHNPAFTRRGIQTTKHIIDHSPLRSRVQRLRC